MKTTSPIDALRRQLLELLEGGHAHIGLADAVAGFPLELIGRRVPQLDHTAWMLLFHVRLVQLDIVEFIRNPQYVSPEYPGGYWPGRDAPQRPEEWGETLDAWRQDREALTVMVRDPRTDFFTPFPHGSGQNLLREALLVADHDAYHIGQLVDLRMLLGVPVRDY